MKKPKKELRAKCQNCNVKLVIAKEDEEIIVAICPECQCETYFTRVRGDDNG